MPSGQRFRRSQPCERCLTAWYWVSMASRAGRGRPTVTVVSLPLEDRRGRAARSAEILVRWWALSNPQAAALPTDPMGRQHSEPRGSGQSRRRLNAVASGVAVGVDAERQADQQGQLEVPLPGHQLHALSRQRAGEITGPGAEAEQVAVAQGDDQRVD